MDDELKYRIGLELLNLSHIIQYIEELEIIYNRYRKKGINIERMDQEKDYSQRFLIIEPLGYLRKINKNDLEESYLGFGIKVFKRDVLVDIATKNKHTFLSNIKDEVKDRIFDQMQKSSIGEFNDEAEHSFIMTEVSIFFNVDIDISRQSISIKDVYAGYSGESRDKFSTNRYNHMKGLKF